MLRKAGRRCLAAARRRTAGRRTEAVLAALTLLTVLLPGPASAGRPRGCAGRDDVRHASLVTYQHRRTGLTLPPAATAKPGCRRLAAWGKVAAASVRPDAIPDGQQPGRDISAVRASISIESTDTR